MTITKQSSISLELVITLVVLSVSIFGTYLSVKSSIQAQGDSLIKTIERVERVDETVSQIRESQILAEVLSMYRTQDRWSGSMMLEYNTKLRHAIESIIATEDKKQFYENYPDIKAIQTAFPLGELTKKDGKI